MEEIFPKIPNASELIDETTDISQVTTADNGKHNGCDDYHSENNYDKLDMASDSIQDNAENADEFIISKAKVKEEIKNEDSSEAGNDVKENYDQHAEDLVTDAPVLGMEEAVNGEVCDDNSVRKDDHLHGLSASEEVDEVANEQVVNMDESKPNVAEEDAVKLITVQAERSSVYDDDKSKTSTDISSPNHANNQEQEKLKSVDPMMLENLEELMTGKSSPTKTTTFNEFNKQENDKTNGILSPSVEKRYEDTLLENRQLDKNKIMSPTHPHQPAKKFISPVTERPKRVNPFNDMKCVDEPEDLWQMRKSPVQPTDTNNLDFQNLPPGLTSPIDDSLHHTVSHSGEQTSNFLKKGQAGSTGVSSTSHYPSNDSFNLMDRTQLQQPLYQPENHHSKSITGIEAALQEVSLVNNNVPPAATPQLDDPWVKISEPETAPVELNQPSYQNIEPMLPKLEEKEKTFPQQPPSLVRPMIEAAGPCEPADLIEGIIFTANYLGSTQLQSERNPGKNARMMQAQEVVHRIKAPEGESQPSVEVDLFISTDTVKILNADTQETMMDHTLRSISYIADIGNLLVIMAKRKVPRSENSQEPQIMREPKPQRPHRVICHVFSSTDSQLMAQAIGQAFNVAYQQFLSANGIEPQTLTRDDYNELLDMQEMYHDDLTHYSNRENTKDIWVEKNRGEALGVVIVESGWGSIVPTVILANLQHGGPAERCGKLSIGDQIMTVNGTSLVGLPIPTCQSVIKGLRSQTIARLNIVSCPPVVTVLIKRPDLKYQLGFSVQEGIICSLLRGGIAERGGVRVGHRIIEINGQSVVATPHERIVQMLVSSVGEIQMKTMPATMYRLLTGQEQPVYI